MRTPSRLMKCAVVLYCGFSVLFTASAQISINGFVKSDQGDPVPFANVLLLQPDDGALVLGAVSDEDGAFVLTDVSPGNYHLQTSMLGYQDLALLFLQLDGSDKRVDLGILTIKESFELLQEVEVRARKPLYEQKVDRLVVNVQNSVTAAGNTALEILERSPGVIVNRQSNSLSIGGKSGVMILINGRRSRLPEEAFIQLLASTNAANIERIEILTAPPAKYDADGNAGAINIVMRKSREEGWNGSLSATGGYGRAPKTGGSLLLNWRKNKVDLYADYSFLHNQTQQIAVINGRIDFQDHLTENKNIFDREAFINTHNVRIGLDVDLSDRTVLGISFHGNSSYWNMDANNQIRIDTNLKNRSRMSMDMQEVNHWTQMAGNLNLNHAFRPDHTVEVNLDYLNYYNNNPSDYLVNYLDQNEQTIRGGDFPAEEEHPHPDLGSRTGLQFTAVRKHQITIWYKGYLFPL